MKQMNRVALALVVGLSATSIGAAEEADGKREAVAVLRGVRYANGSEDERRKLDLYLPREKREFPVLLFLHGGGFSKGGRKDVEKLGETFARQGVGVAAAGYRLAPGAKHPAQVSDAARAFGWLRKNIGRHGGNPDRLFVGGHSAGALLATDEQYLKAEGAGLKDVKGVVALATSAPNASTQTHFGVSDRSVLP
jgi:acetyl esterase/lipase